MTIFFIVLAIIILIMLLIVCSSLRIDINELEVVNKKIVKLKLIISLALFGKVKWIRFKIDNKKIEKLKNTDGKSLINKILNSKILKKYNKNAKEIAIRNWKEIIKQLNKVKIEKVKLRAQIGTENAAITALTTGVLSAILGIILARKTEIPQYEINPIYIDRNYIYLSINCIISIKMVHIISMKKELKGKEVYQKHGGTSNRRAYANSNG